MAETARPNSVTGVTTAQHYRDRFRVFQPDHVIGAVTDAMGVNLGTSSTVGTSVNVANGQAKVQGMLYNLTGGPLNLSTGGNPVGSNRQDIVCLTYDDTHDPIVYARIIQGTAGAGLPATTNNPTGVWDFPIAHYTKSPAGVISAMTDRRVFTDGCGRSLGKDVFGAGLSVAGNYMAGWSAPPERLGHEQVFYPSMNAHVYDGVIFAIKEGVFRPSTYMTKNNNTTLAAVSGLAFPVHANSKYVFDMYLRYEAPSANSDMKIGMTVPAAATAFWGGIGDYYTQTGSSGIQDFAARTEATSYGYATIAGVGMAARPQGIIITGANSGLVQITMAQQAAVAENTTIHSESYVHVRKCA